MKSNGLRIFFFIKEKSSLFKISDILILGDTTIAASICTFGAALATVSAGIIAGASLLGLGGILIGGVTIVNVMDCYVKGYKDNYF